jgi:hypothetical protein
VKLSKLQISELNTLVQKETSGDVEGNLLLRTNCLKLATRVVIVSKSESFTSSFFCRSKSLRSLAVA